MANDKQASPTAAREGNLPKELMEVVEELYSKYDADDVALALQKHKPTRRGPRQIYGDRAVLEEVGNADALLWMEGKDPFQERPSYQIAKDYARKNPGHSEQSTVARINRKLRNRRKTALYKALILHLLSMTLTQARQYFDEVAQNVPILKDLLLLNGWDFDLIAKNYNDCFGQPPSDSKSLKELREEIKDARASQQRGGLLTAEVRDSLLKSSDLFLRP